jgi:uncharacterized membrane protein
MNTEEWADEIYEATGMVLSDNQIADFVALINEHATVARDAAFNRAAEALDLMSNGLRNELNHALTFDMENYLAAAILAVNRCAVLVRELKDERHD